MKKLLTVIALMGFFSFTAVAQNENHPTISTYTLNFADANMQSSASVPDSAVIATYVIILKNTANLNKIYLRVSSGQQTTGNILSINYPLNSVPVVDSHGITLFMRDNNVIYIRTIMAHQTSGKNYEVCTEDNQGQKSPYLGKLK